MTIHFFYKHTRPLCRLPILSIPADSSPVDGVPRSTTEIAHRLASASSRFSQTDPSALSTSGGISSSRGQVTSDIVGPF